ncbi:MAG: hypothetical protein COA80_02930 [Leeuwenhoekiella sp.]|nr:MAG: hypothetical protein COA80_02930 [Leeuwenhoekiella sp.]
MRRAGKWIGGALAACAAAIVGAYAYDQRPARHIAGILRIASVPVSVSDAQCKSWGFPDTLETCTFSLNAADFPKLVRGAAFQERRVAGSSYTYSGGPKLGPQFEVSTLYEVTPPEFTNGGNIRLVTNRDRTKAQADLWIN